MRFVSPEVVIQHDDLNRRVMRFYMLDRHLVLDLDTDEVRKTKRHKWKAARKWSRLDRRDNTLERREVPQSAIDEALRIVRDGISYRAEESA
jgi:hypothetical protein